QKDIYIKLKEKGKYSIELAFATFFLNRTNHSGIIAGGPIGGVLQNSKDKLDCRFNKENLIEKIIFIANREQDISLFNLDASELIDEIIKTHHSNELFIFFDPPYYKKGKYIYNKFFYHIDHNKLYKNIY